MSCCGTKYGSSVESFAPLLLFQWTLCHLAKKREAPLVLAIAAVLITSSCPARLPVAPLATNSSCSLHLKAAYQLKHYGVGLDCHLSFLTVVGQIS